MEIVVRLGLLILVLVLVAEEPSDVCCMFACPFLAVEGIHLGLTYIWVVSTLLYMQIWHI
jgi:hypothetical protein